MSIPFSFRRPQDNYRLLELPSEVLKLLTSPHPPMLQLKSTNPDVSDVASHVVLCSPDRTYQVRQVQSSNSMFLVQPLSASDSAQDGYPAISGISAIAQCKASLELIPIISSAVAFLKRTLPVYEDPLRNNEVGLSSRPEAEKLKSRRSILRDAPMSEREFEIGCTEICAFESEGQALRPTAATLLGVWRSLLSAALAKDLKFEGQWRWKELVNMVEEDGYPEPLLQAMLKRLSLTGLKYDPLATIDRDKCVLWVGLLYLETLKTGGGGILEAAFLLNWQECLPSVWSGQATLGLLEGHFVRVHDGRIVSKEETTSSSSPADFIAPTDMSKRGARNWHERFKSAKG